MGGRVDEATDFGTGSSRLVFPDSAFIFCGSEEIEDETLDRLNLWRAYGENGYGIAITTVWSRERLAKDGLAILPVKYVSTAEFEDLKNQNIELQKEIDDATNAREFEKAEKLRVERMNLEVGYKGSDYASEEELRIVYYAGDQSGVVPQILNYTADSGRLRTYITRKVKIGLGQTLTGLYITVGPRVPEYEASHWKKMADWTIRQIGLSSLAETRQSELPYVG